jgi:hypothetical protein
MSLAHNPALIAIELIASSIWVGSLVCLVVVSRAASTSIDPDARVALFRALGQRYGFVGSVALLTAIGVGLAMAWPPVRWSNPLSASVALAGILVVLTMFGVRQARAMSRIRRDALSDLGNSQLARSVRRGARSAAVARGLIAGVTLAIVVLAAYVIAG